MLAEVIAQARDDIGPFLSDRRLDAVYRGAARQRLEQLVADMEAVLRMLDESARSPRRRRADRESALASLDRLPF